MDELNIIAKHIVVVEKELGKYTELFNKDHTIDIDERKKLDELNAALKKVRNEYKIKRDAIARKTNTLEGYSDSFINKLEDEQLTGNVANIGTISLSAYAPKNTVFMSHDWHLVDLKSPEGRSMSVTALINKKGLKITFFPYLFVDVLGPMNGMIKSLNLNFKTGNLSTVVDGYFTGKIEKKIKKGINGLLKNTIFNKNKHGNIFPYNPYSDPDLQQNFANFQKQLMQEFSKSENKREDGITKEFNSVQLGAGLDFVKDYSYDFGAGKAVIKKGSSISVVFKLNGSLDNIVKNPKKVKINEVVMSTKGIDIFIKNKPQITIKKVTLNHGGKFDFDEIIILNEIVNGIKLIEGLATIALILLSHGATPRNVPLPLFKVLTLNQMKKDSLLIDGIALTIIEKRIEAMIAKAIEDSLQETAKTYGFDVKKALGLK